MAEVKMNLKELEAIQNETKLAKEETERIKKELNEEISKLTKQKEELIQNQKRVILSKREYQVTKYLPVTYQEIYDCAKKAIDELADDRGYYRRDDLLERYASILRDLPRYFMQQVFHTRPDYSQKGRDSENLVVPEIDHYEFINLDEAVNMALEQNGSVYGQRLKKLEKSNLDLASELSKLEAKAEEKIEEIREDKEKEIERIIKEKDSLYDKLKETSELEYKELKETSDKQYKELKETSDKQYKTLEEEFAKYKDDEEKMNIKDLLEKYKKENEELKSKLEQKPHKKWYKLFLFE